MQRIKLNQDVIHITIYLPRILNNQLKTYVKTKRPGGRGASKSRVIKELLENFLKEIK